MIQRKIIPFFVGCAMLAVAACSSSVGDGPSTPSKTTVVVPPSDGSTTTTTTYYNSP